MDESVTNHLLEEARTELSTYEERLQAIKVKVEARLQQLSEDYLSKLQAVGNNRSLEAATEAATSDNQPNNPDDKKKASRKSKTEVVKN